MEFYHALESPEGSKQGVHTAMMNDAIDYANHRWGLEPINEEKRDRKKSFSAATPQLNARLLMLERKRTQNT